MFTVTYRVNGNWWDKKFDSQVSAEAFYQFLSKRLRVSDIYCSWHINF